MDPDAPRRLIARLLSAASRGAVADVMTERIAADLPDLRADDAIFGALAASVEANVENVTHAVVLDVPVERIEVPLAALEYPRRVAQRGMAATSLVRAYYLGQQTMIGLLGEALDAEADADHDLREAAMRWLIGWSFDYNDVVTRRVLDEYEAERAAWVDARSGARTVRVLEVLDGDVPSESAASATIRYPLRATHIGLVAWYSEGVDEVERIERFLRELGTATGTAAPPLSVAVDRLTAWAWLPVADGDAAISAARALVAADPDAPRVVLGPPRDGIEGFRATNRAAREVRRVADATGARLLVATDPGVGLAALVAQDVGAASAWADGVLGPLTGDSAADERLRSTLEIFLRTGGSFKATAEQQTMHANSVKYRVRRAVARRGREIGDDRLDVEVALAVRRIFGPHAPGNPARKAPDAGH
ncbi:helix-turn-helix domain-containing protein [Tsukamurella paurometabola]|uniref:Sugar diacid utilization regulator n=1 Tax=Tsukamurella paurometabola TaxID=2061 RepID=A0A3P8L3R2_TSUPA|nr:helix-turn-helix domain-containing protein [Tsukamurella paurometabola]UEA82782.1 helix-turn-helix domain-containing protein [Tsukamurella paurometabola]VDR39855.1 Sugar diacid utilization regulator [Tsukamurella paurometabola]